MLTRFLAAAIFSWRAFSSASAILNANRRAGNQFCARNIASRVQRSVQEDDCLKSYGWGMKLPTVEEAGSG